jgi:hypothetical protein
MSSPVMELRSTNTISRPQVGHFVSDAFEFGVRKYRTVIQDGNFIATCPNGDAR